MVHARLPRLAVLAAAACLALPAPSSAQIGGFLKKKLKQAIAGGDSAVASKAAPAGPTFDENVLELSTPNLDRFERALTAEKAFRDSVQSQRTATPTLEQYDRCRQRAAAAPEAQALTKASPPDALAYQKSLEQYQALLTRSCGDPPELEPTGTEVGPSEIAGARAGGLTSRQYAIMKERVTPFCAAPAARVRGESSTVFYVYSPAEITALQPRCARIAPGLAALGAGEAATSGRKSGGGEVAATPPHFVGDTLELTPEVVGRLERYYAFRATYTDSMRALSGKANSESEWKQCAAELWMSPWGKTLMQSAGADPQRAKERMTQEMAKKCGPNPDEVSHPDRYVGEAAANALWLDRHQVGVMQRRIQDLCNERPNRRMGSGRGQGFTSLERSTVQPRCGKLLPLINANPSP